MITLIIDTSHSILAVGIARDGIVIDSIQEVLKKKHSERLVCAVNEVLTRAGISKQAINEIVVTDGPGSYTGMRIGMTFVKVLSLTCDVDVYTVDTLLSLVGNRSGFSMIDARSNRIFGAEILDGKLHDERVYKVESVQSVYQNYYGDCHLLGLETVYGDIVQNILDVRSAWTKIDNPDIMVPRYLS